MLGNELFELFHAASPIACARSRLAGSIVAELTAFYQ
jgi:hypothetical protein